MLRTVVLFVLCLAGLVWFLRNDLAEYAAFKRLTETADRQRRYRIWLVRSFLLFFCGSLLCLGLLGRLSSLLILPAEFGALSGRLSFAHSGAAAGTHGSLSPFIVGTFLGGALAGLAATVVFRRVRLRPVGDIEALLPRNGPESAWMALISLNAGLSEECFFRLVLPLLLTQITGRALIAFLVASVIFGLVHLYQGWPGILATMFMGLLLSAVYLWSATLWIPVIVHAGIDLIGAVVRPALARRMNSAR
jgi:membrane protease YdiL (CAAX protease family)